MKFRRFAGETLRHQMQTQKHCKIYAGKTSQKVFYYIVDMLFSPNVLSLFFFSIDGSPTTSNTNSPCYATDIFPWPSLEPPLPYEHVNAIKVVTQKTPGTAPMIGRSRCHWQCAVELIGRICISDICFRFNVQVKIDWRDKSIY